MVRSQALPTLGIQIDASVTRSCGCTRTRDHQCPERASFNPEGGYGKAIESITFVQGTWWAHSENGEYASEIGFCPWCGVKLPTTTR